MTTSTADIPGAYVRDVIALCGRWHVPAGELTRGLPVTVAALAAPETRVPLAVCAEIVARAHRLTREPALALYVGWQMRLSTHGYLGFAAMTAATVREAIELAVRFAATRTTAIGLALEVEGAAAALVVEERADLGPLREFAVLSLVVGLWQLGRALTGRPLVGTAECGFPAPAFIAQVPFAAGMIRFERPAHRMRFAASVLDLPITSADPVALELARGQCERELAAIVDAGLPARVRAEVVARVDGDAALPAVARALRLSTRTLKRKLAERDTTFTAIVDDLRRQRALLLLDDRALSIGEVAARVGYTELPNFTRAFKRWTGMTPAAYRTR
ncbi:MAG: AraC family transcriptional regulator ligand-binding domain-containing protein [Myxococcales bacterium]|nr:AraC family transcriptional regulator ligand-binding domain-containing protein [Myxococcales bacterium]